MLDEIDKQYKSDMNKLCPIEVTGIEKTSNLICYSLFNKILVIKNNGYNGFKIRDKAKINYNHLNRTPPKINYEHINKSVNAKVVIKNAFIEFERVMRKNDIVAYNNFCVNGAKLHLTDFDLFKHEKRVKGYYSPQNVLKYDNGTKEEKNVLYVTTASKLKLRDRTLHELMHMASTNPKSENSGFFQKSKIIKSEIGRNFNEGATEIMCESYFKDYHPSYSNYIIEYAKSIRNIVGRDKFEALYFDTDLKGLIREMARYSSEEEVINFIAKLDDLSYYRPYIKYDRVKKACKELFDECNDYIHSCIMVKNEIIGKSKNR